MVNYANAKIYKIVSGDRVYIGATCMPLNQRLSLHKSEAKRYINGLHNKICMSYFLCNRNDTQIELIEEYPCENSHELMEREKHYINTMKCINKHKNTMHEDYQKEYYNSHKDQYKIYYREYYLNQKPKFQNYYQTNKERLKEYQKLRYRNKINNNIDDIN